jgi:hypothetical protein
MKSVFFSLVAVAVMAFTGTSIATADNAIVDRLQGFYIFTDCKPVQDYTYVATVTVSISEFGDVIGEGSKTNCFCDPTYSTLKNAIIAKAKKKKIVGDAIIINPDGKSGDVIKFK